MHYIIHYMIKEFYSSLCFREVDSVLLLKWTVKMQTIYISQFA